MTNGVKLESDSQESLGNVHEMVRESEVDDIQDLWNNRLGHAYTTRQGTVTGLPMKFVQLNSLV